MSPAGRPPSFPIKKVLGFNKELMAEIDDWRRHQEEVPTFSDAVRELVRLGLAGSPKPRVNGGSKRKVSTDGVKR